MRRPTGTRPKRQPSRKIYEEGPQPGTCEQQFFQSFGRVHDSTRLGPPPHSANHLNSNLGIFTLLADPHHHIKVEGTRKDKQIADNIPSHMSEQQLEYLSYLKDYSTILKKSRINYTENVDKSQEIDSLISQFLCGRDREGEKVQPQGKGKGKSKIVSHSKDSVCIRKVQLDGPKIEEPKGRIKQKSTQSKAKTLDPKTANQQSTGSCAHIASKENTKVEIIGTRILKKDKKQGEITASPASTPEGIVRRSRFKTQLDTPRQLQGQRYSIGLKKDKQSSLAQNKQSYQAQNKQSYLAQNKQSYLAQNMGESGQRRKDEQAERGRKGGERRKPIKIAIDIPLEELGRQPGRVGEYGVESSVGVEGAELRLVREVAERVMSLLQKSKGKLVVC